MLGVGEPRDPEPVSAQPISRGTYGGPTGDLRGTYGRIRQGVGSSPLLLWNAQRLYVGGRYARDASHVTLNPL